jgi:hypothetical protein
VARILTKNNNMVGMIGVTNHKNFCMKNRENKKIKKKKKKKN